LLQVVFLIRGNQELVIVVKVVIEEVHSIVEEQVGVGYLITVNEQTEVVLHIQEQVVLLALRQFPYPCLDQFKIMRVSSRS